MGRCAERSRTLFKRAYIWRDTKGITLLPEIEKRTELEKWLEAELPARFKDRLLPVTAGIAEIWGSMAAKAQMEGIALGAIDGLLGATAANHELTVATRNVPDFLACNVPLINPWDF